MKLTSTDTASHIKITQAGALALLVAIGGLVVGLVPSWAPYERVIISSAPAILAAVFLIANAGHALAGSRAPALLGEPITGQVGQVTSEDTAAAAREEARAEVSRLFQAALVAQADVAPPPAPPATP